jgi:hypothetical protein
MTISPTDSPRLLMHQQQHLSFSPVRFISHAATACIILSRSEFDLIRDQNANEAAGNSIVCVFVRREREREVCIIAATPAAAATVRGGVHSFRVS